MPRRCDLWRVGIAHAAIGEIAARGAVDPAAVDWLPEEADFRFLADPFGLFRDGRLHLFVEAYDYRTRHGVIDWMALDESFRPVDRRTVLREPWHLSYPQLFETDDEVWMLPEASRSGRLRLYRATDFPTRWAPAAEILLDVVPIDATIVRHEGRWWILYSGGSDRTARMGSLRCAWSDRLDGPWHCHPANPIRVDIAGARPGGTPFLRDGVLTLPVQDCSRTYGGAVRLLELCHLSPDRVETRLGPAILPPRDGNHQEGMHTLSACGPVTLIDAKRIDRSGRGWLIDLARSVGWWRGLD